MLGVGQCWGMPVCRETLSTHTQGWGRGKSHPFSIQTLQADLTDKGTVALHSSGRDFMLEGSRMI